MEISESINKIEVPEEVENYIKKGIEKGRNKKILQKKKRMLSYAAASILIIFFVLSIRLSPSVAAYVSQIRVLKQL
ncbi:hypothetical protein [Thermoanaerobacter wiegelii]|nr:hypothetical protein [Thermoanaerobacter wiegelii]